MEIALSSWILPVVYRNLVTNMKSQVLITFHSLSFLKSQSSKWNAIYSLHYFESESFSCMRTDIKLLQFWSRKIEKMNSGVCFKLRVSVSPLFSFWRKK